MIPVHELRDSTGRVYPDQLVAARLQCSRSWVQKCRYNYGLGRPRNIELSDHVEIVRCIWPPGAKEQGDLDSFPALLWAWLPSHELYVCAKELASTCTDTRGLSMYPEVRAAVVAWIAVRERQTTPLDPQNLARLGNDESGRRWERHRAGIERLQRAIDGRPLHVGTIEQLVQSKSAVAIYRS